MVSVSVRLTAQLGAAFFGYVLQFIVESAPVTGALFIWHANHDCSADTTELARFEAHPRTWGSEQLSSYMMAPDYGEAKCLLAQLMSC